MTLVAQASRLCLLAAKAAQVLKTMLMNTEFVHYGCQSLSPFALFAFSPITKKAYF